MIFEALIVVIKPYISIQKVWHNFLGEEEHNFRDNYNVFITGKVLL
jgi:hypothetical protein